LGHRRSKEGLLNQLRWTDLNPNAIFLVHVIHQVNKPRRSFGRHKDFFYKNFQFAWHDFPEILALEVQEQCSNFSFVLERSSFSPEGIIDARVVLFQVDVFDAPNVNFPS